MAVTLTGTPNYFQQDANGGDLGVTIPADCTGVIVILGHDGGNDFSQLNWNDDAAQVDFQAIVSIAGGASDYEMYSYIMTTADGTNWPGIGSQTLSWACGAYDADGPRLLGFFVKGLDVTTTTSGFGDSDSSAGQNINTWTATLTGVSSGDLSIIAACCYEYGNYEVDAEAGAGQTAIWEAPTVSKFMMIGAGREDGESGPQIDITNAGGDTYFAGLAFVLEQAAVAGGGLTLPIARRRGR